MAVLRHLAAGLLALLVAVGAAAEPLPLTVLHFNDFHGHLEPVTDRATGETLGGIARLAGAIRAVRDEDPKRPVVVLFAGDMLQGTVTSTVFLGLPDLEMLAAAGVDVAVMGNHELDFGQDHFRTLLSRARYPILGANVRAAPEPFALRPSVILEPPGGPRVAVLGLVTEELTTTTHPRNAVGVGVDDAIATALALVPGLEAQADLVVVLSHLGIAADRALAREVPGVDLVVGGHNHNRYEQPVLENGVPIVQAGDWGRWLGRMDLEVDEGAVRVVAYRLLPIDAGVPEDPAIAAQVRALAQRLEAEVGVIVGRLTADLDGSREVIRRGESAFGNLLGDLARELTGSDVALFNGGGIRSSIPAGDVRLKHVYEAIPFANELVTGTLTGAQLRAALEHSAGLDPLDNPGGFLQVSGLRYAIRDGRLDEVTVGGQPLRPDARYRVVMPDFLAAGGDGYATLAAMEDKVATGRIISDMLVEAFRARGTIVPATDGRIVRR
ncbi:MAG: bifunctional metallophosphatase/5'-nucleotidase [Gammaproteobacteria bacterium]|jgi:2',3'-cyclic-nucleotide 2'-phosphodiesterase (5'-nucleotidase family)|nr:bifunctional metallophosphatase/5'-nucleotidase [Gammaproteobacteria bacterium]